MNGTLIFGLAAMAAVTLLSAEKDLTSATPGKVIAPPPMPRRPIAPSTNAVPGETVSLEDGGVKFTLFIPRGWNAAAAKETSVTIHFHTVAWFVIQEHARRGAKEPLICFQLGEGSTVYREPFEDTARFGRVVRIIESELKKHGASSSLQIAAVDVSSFSAGYGAVRELIKSPESFKSIRRIVLLDSMYAGYAETNAVSSVRRPLPEQIDVWVPFARAAMEGQKTFVFTHSAVPTGKYASSAECADALLKALGVSRVPVERGSCAAASDPEFPLRSRADAGNLHIWGYGGEDAQAHLTHVRHMADVWTALDK